MTWLMYGAWFLGGFVTGMAVLYALAAAVDVEARLYPPTWTEQQHWDEQHQRARNL
jgi:hypothetical protein